MRVERDAVIAGQPAKRVRDFFRDLMRYPRDSFHLSCVKEFFDADIREGLLAADLIALDRENGFTITPKACRLAGVRFVAPISRAKAKRLVAELLQRVERINADPQMTVRVTRIDAFGSYITKAPDLGDIDLFVTWERKDPPAGLKWTDWNIQIAEQSGRRSLSYVNMLYFGDHAARRHLRGGSPYISLHDISERQDLKGVRTRRLYPTKAGSVPRLSQIVS
jgi:hypothetical protein